MENKEKIIFAMGVAGLYIPLMYVFTYLSTVLASLLASYFTGTLFLNESNTQKLFQSFKNLSIPYLIVVTASILVFFYSKRIEKKYVNNNSNWLSKKPLMNELKYVTCGLLLLFTGLFSFIQYSVQHYDYVVAAFSSIPYRAIFLKVALPSYLGNLLEITLGIWLVIFKGKNK